MQPFPDDMLKQFCGDDYKTRAIEKPQRELNSSGGTSFTRVRFAQQAEVLHFRPELLARDAEDPFRRSVLNNAVAF